MIFALPMFINIAYVVFPPSGEAKQPSVAPNRIEIVEQISRVAYLFAITLLVSRDKVGLRSVWLYLAVFFLVLYYTVWIRYFAGGREIALLNRPFLLVPMPLAVFPVLYFLCVAVWLHNIPAVIVMVVFGVAHLSVSFRSFH